MRMPRAEIGFEPDSEGRILNTFVKLKEMRMSFADADPDNFRRAFGGKCSHAFDRQKEGAKLNRVEFFLKLRIDILRHFAKETEGEMHLIGRHPMYAGNVRIKIDKCLFDRSRQIDGDEETLHCD